jgi:hypothetical protein
MTYADDDRTHRLLTANPWWNNALEVAAGDTTRLTPLRDLGGDLVTSPIWAIVPGSASLKAGQFGAALLLDASFRYAPGHHARLVTRLGAWRRATDLDAVHQLHVALMPLFIAWTKALGLRPASLADVPKLLWQLDEVLPFDHACYGDGDDALREVARAIAAWRRGTGHLGQYRLGAWHAGAWAATPEGRQRLARLSPPLDCRALCRDLTTNAVLAAWKIAGTLGATEAPRPPPDPEAMDLIRARPLPASAGQPSAPHAGGESASPLAIAAADVGAKAAAGLALEAGTGALPAEVAATTPETASSARPPSPLPLPDSDAPPSPEELRGESEPSVIVDLGATPRPAAESPAVTVIVDTAPRPTEDPRSAWWQAVREWGRARKRPNAPTDLLGLAQALERRPLWTTVSNELQQIGPSSARRADQRPRLVLALVLDEYFRARPAHFPTLLDHLLPSPETPLSFDHCAAFENAYQAVFEGWAATLANKRLEGAAIPKQLHRFANIVPWDDQSGLDRDARTRQQDEAIDIAFQHAGASSEQIWRGIYWAAIRVRNDSVHGNGHSLHGRVRPTNLRLDMLLFHGLGALRFRAALARRDELGLTMPNIACI